jgi:hypothetical protein
LIHVDLDFELERRPSREERIRQRAFELSQRQPEREAQDHWLQAEWEIRREILLADDSPHPAR